MNLYYENKKILITGAASGIGRLFASKVNQPGNVTLILWDRNGEELNAFRNELKQKGAQNVLVSAVDISDPDRIQMEAEHLKKEGFLPDIIVNCAAIVTGSYFHELTVNEIEKTIRINTLGSMWVVQAFLSDMIERGSGQIVNMGSASGYIGNPKMSVYASSKWAILGWSESLRLEMEQLQTGVGVTTVIPSYVNTGMFSGVKAPVFTPILTTEQIVNKMLKGIASGKTEIRAPFIVHFTPFLKAALPKRVFDWLAGRVFGVYHSMDTFEGRKEKK